MRVCRPTVLKFDALKVVDHYIRPEGGYPGVAEDVENDTHMSVQVDSTDYGIVIHQLSSTNAVHFLYGHSGFARV